jgi:hypothetical protein
MSEPKEHTGSDKPAPIIFRHQVSDVIHLNGYRAMVVVSGNEISIDGEVDGHAFDFRAHDGWYFGISKAPLSESQKADVFKQDALVDEDHPIGQAVSGPFAFNRTARPDRKMSPYEALCLVDELIDTFRLSRRNAAAIEG